MEVLPDTVAIGYVHPNTVTERFSYSLAQACLAQRDNNIIAILSASSPRQEHARNTVIGKFLDGTRHGNMHVGAEWLMWIDTDMVFEPLAIKQLRNTAKNHKADMACGLAFVYKRHDNVLVPNVYTFDHDTKNWLDTEDYPRGIVKEVDATGSAFVLINRRVLEGQDDYWHVSGIHPATGNYMGHDLAFFYDRVVDGPFKLVWDSNVKTGHVKHFELTEEQFDAYRRTV